MVFEAGELLLERYRVKSLLGTGASGAVYGVQDVILEQPFALKVYWERMTPEDPAFRRVRREVMAAQRAPHPNLVAIHDVVFVEGRPALVMEWVRGETLRERIRREGPLPLDATVTLMWAILGGLQCLHGMGIVHRDIKSSNVLIGENGDVKLADLGLVRGEDLGATLTATGEAFGTPGYMAPEIIKGRQATPQSDLYACGVVLFEMLAGHLPFEGSSVPEVAGKILTQAPPLEVLKKGGTPRWMVGILSRLLEKDPRDRYRSAENLSASLETRSAGIRVPKRWRRRAVLAALVLPLVLAGAVAGVRSWMAGREATSILVEEFGVKGLSSAGAVLWERSFPGEVRDAGRYDPNPESPNRFFVLYGGKIKSPATAPVPPHLAVLSPQGEVLSDIDLLTTFNPFRGPFRDDLFTTRIACVEDLNGDGFADVLAECIHTFYPSLLHFFSGRERAVTGGFANSGHIDKILPVPTAHLGPEEMPTHPVYILAVNNRMAHQQVLANVNFSGFDSSPDLEARGAGPSADYRPLGNPRIANQQDLSVGPRGSCTLRTGDRTIRMDRFGSLDTDPGFGDPNRSEVAARARGDLYKKVQVARRQVREGKLDMGGELYRQAVAACPDAGLELYVRVEAERELREAGRPHMALDFLPENPESCPSPGSVLLRKGELLLILGRPDKASEMFLAARDLPGVQTWYGFEGFVEAAILQGQGPGEIHRSVYTEYTTLLDTSGIRAWLLASGVLLGEIEETEIALERMDLKGSDPLFYSFVYPQEEAVWRAIADVLTGKGPARWPDETDVKGEPDPVFPLKIDLLKALDARRTDPGPESLARLAKVTGDLEQASLRHAGAVVPHVLAAYEYGFAAWEAGDEKVAREVLTHALAKYPHGKYAERSRRILEE